MVTNYLRNLVTTIVCLTIGTSLFGQQYRVHMTERTVRFTADNVSTYNISNCVGGVFIAKESNNNVSYIIDTLCHTLGGVHLQSTLVSFYPNFYGGRVATAILSDGTPAVINTKGEIVKQFPEGRKISTHFVDGVAMVSVINPQTFESLVVYINENGEQVFKNLTMKNAILGINLDVAPLRDGLRRYYDSEKQLYGFVDKDGRIIISARFKKAHDFSDGLAAVTSNDGTIEYWGFIDTTGKAVIAPTFRTEPGDYHDGFAVVKKQNGKYVFIDKNAQVKTREYDRATRFFHGFALVNAQNQYGADWSKCYVLDTDFKRVRTINFYSPNQIQYNEYNETFIMDSVVFYPDGRIKLNPTRPGSLMRGFIEDIALYSCNEYTGFINSKGEVLMFFVQSEF